MRPHFEKLRPALALLLVGMIALATMPASPAYAIGSSITVKTSAGDKTADDGACSLREALQAIVQPSNDDCGSPSAPLTITFDAPGTIKLPGGVLPFISKVVTITGPVIIDGSNGKPAGDPAYAQDNILVVASGGTLNLASLTLTKGSRAITVNGGTLNAAGVSFLSNTQDGAGGAAIYSTGAVNVAGSLFTANSAPGSTGTGGAIVAAGSDQMNIAGSIFTGNTAKNSGGAIYATTKLNLTDTIFNGNIAEGDDGDDDSWDEGGGAVFFRPNNSDYELNITRGVFNGNLSPEGSGGALFLNSDAKVRVEDSALNGNLAGTPGEPRSGGAIFNAGVLNLLHSTLLNNGVVGNGGAIANDRRGQLNASNSTLVANLATFDPADPAAGLGRGGGIATLNSQTGSDIRPLTTLLNVTLALNASVGGSATAGGGLYSQAPTSSHPEVTIMGNTIVSGSDATGGNCGGGAYTSLGHNLDSGASCGLGGAGDLQGANANLDASFFNGGPISTLLTMKLKPGSAALEAGDGAICAADPVGGEDQRGKSRPQNGDGAGAATCDIGAYEGDAAFAGFGSDPVAPGPIPFGNATVGVSLPGSLSVFNTGDAALTISAGAVTGSNAGDFALNTAFPISIAAGAPAKTIGLTCTPSATGPRLASLQLSTNAPGAASVSFELSCVGTPVPTAGFGSDPATPGPIDLGKVRVGQSKSLPLQISEIGTATLSVTSIQIGGLHPGDFSLSSTANISIANGAAAVARNVGCAPTALGQRSATLTMQTNDPANPSVSFSLSCTGAPAPQLVFEGAGTTVSTSSGPYGVTVSPEGKNVYVSNDGVGTINRYARNAGGYPTGVLTYTDGSLGGANLGGARISLLSPDGRFVYTSAYADNTINVFERNPEDGRLTILADQGASTGQQYGCVIGPCPNSILGLSGAYGVALSPDGKYLYVSGVNSDSITVLARNPATGSLRRGSFPFRPAVVQEYQSATNLNGAYELAISPDGKHLYATGYLSDSLAVFSRDANSGQITPVSGGVYKAGDPGLGGLNGVFRVTLSPDGNFVYTGSYDGDSIMAFRRDPASGKLTPVAGGTYSFSQSLTGLNSVTSVAVSPDGRYLFATGFDSDAVSIFQRNQETGELDELQVITLPALDGARDVAVAPDGRMIFVTGHEANRLTAFAIANPVPTLTSLEPASATAGGPQLTLTVNGEGFAPGAVVTWGGADLAGTQYIGANELRATVPAAKLAAAGAAQVGVRNPAPAGGNSANTLAFTITAPNQNPVPSIDEISPAGAPAGADQLVVTITGAGFMPESRALWNGEERPTAYLSGSALQVTIAAGDLAQPGVSGVAVRNPAPGGGVSNVAGFEVAAPGENPVPAITSIAPKSAIAGAVSSEVVVTISGANFTPESQARWEGNARPTTYVGPGELRVAVGAGDLLDVGTYGIDVVSPAPGGGASNAAVFRVGAAGSNPVPSATRVAVSPGAGGVKVTITGQGFVQGAKAYWNGKAYTPSSITGTTIVFTVPHAELGTALVRVENPAPGGGASDEILVTVFQVALPLIRR